MTDHDIAFIRLSGIELDEIATHMSDPVMAVHMPLLAGPWDRDAARHFVEAKEACWERDGLGHWAFLKDDQYVGWGGFQKEGEEWDFGLVLKREHFGLGSRIARKALAFAVADPRIPYVTFLLPPTRTRLGALARLGARPEGMVELEGAQFQKFRLETS